MATNVLEFLITAKDEASKVFEKVGAAAEASGTRMQKLGARMKVGLAVGAVALGVFAKKSVDAYTESEQSQAKLEDAYKRFPKLADVHISKLREINDALQAKTGYDHNDAAVAEATLAQYKLTGAQLVQLTPLVEDYAAKTGRDLPAAATLLGKALLGNGRSLKEVGINFKDTHSIAGNFDQIMTGLRTNVGGFAEKEGRTAAGQSKILGAQFKDLEEKTGSALVPALTKLVGVGIKVVGWITNTKGVLPGLAIGLGIATAAWLAMTIAASPFILLGVGIVGAIAGIVVAVKNWGEITSWFKGIWHDVAGWFTRTVTDPLRHDVGNIVKAFDNAKDGIGKAWSGIKSAVAKPVNFVLGTVYNNGIAHWWNTIANAVGLSSLKLPAAHMVRFAGGGVLPGYTPGRDVHQFYSPTGGRLALSGGEAIMRPEWVRMVGGAKAIARMNKAAIHGQHFASGGIWNTIGTLASKAGHAVTSVGGTIASFLSNPAKAVTSSLGSIVAHLLGGIGHGSLGRILGGFPRRMVSDIAHKVSGAIFGTGLTGNPGGSQGNPVGLGVQRWAPYVLQALAANGLSAGLLNKVLAQIATESGGNPNAINLWDSNAKAGHPSQGLMQTIPSTFAAYMFPGHGNILNGYDNLLAALNYAKHRYGPNLSALGLGHGYANGGILPAHYAGVFDTGGTLAPGMNAVYNATGRNEQVRPGGLDLSEGTIDKLAARMAHLIATTADLVAGANIDALMGV